MKDKIPSILGNTALSSVSMCNGVGFPDRVVIEDE